MTALLFVGSISLFSQSPQLALNQPRQVAVLPMDYFKNFAYQNLEKYWDTVKVCKNPHKGWYLHYFDNGITRYGNKLQPNDYLEDFPGLNDIYLRLAWSYLEPKEGKYNWEIIDKEINRWTKRGHMISFRITCKETGEQSFATPEWVKESGAKGTFITHGKYSVWEPDYGNPIFLQKLENFHKAFAARYDGQPWLEYVDIGSYGDWGEGHTFFGSKKDWPVEVIKKHIDIHCKYYRKSLLVISDDFVGSRTNVDDSREEILRYIVQKGLTLRDDSISVKWFADHYGKSTLRNPEFFDLFWEHKPVNLELEHYQATKDQGTWQNGIPFREAIREAHATYIGFHGYPREWLAENPQLARQLANLAGYWYFLKTITLPEYFQSGKKGFVKLVWENHGVAPAYHRYHLELKLSNPENKAEYTVKLESSDNRKWMPGRVVAETHGLVLSDAIIPGTYQVKIGLHENWYGKQRPIELAFKDELKDKDNFYVVGVVEVK